MRCPSAQIKRGLCQRVTTSGHCSTLSLALTAFTTRSKATRENCIKCISGLFLKIMSMGKGIRLRLNSERIRVSPKSVTAPDLNPLHPFSSGGLGWIRRSAHQGLLPNHPGVPVPGVQGNRPESIPSSGVAARKPVQDQDQKEQITGIGTGSLCSHGTKICRRGPQCHCR